MDKQALLEQVYEDSFKDEIEKIAKEKKYTLRGLGAGTSVGAGVGSLAALSSAMKAGLIGGGGAKNTLKAIGTSLLLGGITGGAAGGILGGTAGAATDVMKS